MKKVLFIGDVFGRPGRKIIFESLDFLINKYQLNFVIVNGENSAGGAGITESICEDFYKSGVDAITLGDHVWDQKNFNKVINNIHYVCRPANLSIDSPGKNYLIVEKNNFKLGIYTMLGSSFMKKKSNCCFHATKDLLPILKQKTDAIIAEIHAEATAEKIAYGWYLNGKVTAVLGTHTHVPTADLQILNKKTAYITDIGMCGPYDSIIGSEKDSIIKSFFDGIPRKLLVAKNNVQLHGCIIDIDEHTGFTCDVKKLVYKNS